MADVKQIVNFIGGKFTPAMESTWVESYAPATGEIIARVADSELMEIVMAVQAANKALPNLAKLEVADRARVLLAAAAYLREHRSDLAALQTLETGLSAAVSLRDGVDRAAATFEYYAHAVLTNEDAATSNAEGWFKTHRTPLGLVGVITPWVQPILALAARVAPALACGNVVIAKPSSRAPQSANAFAELFAHLEATAGLPTGVFNLVQGRGVRAGRALVAHPGVATLAFAGRTETGREIQTTAGEFSKRLQLSMGGCNAAVVFADVDLTKVAPLVARLSLGSAISPELRPARIFVQETVYTEFRELFAKEVENLKDVSPLISKAEQTKFVEAVKLATKENGRPLSGTAEAIANKGFIVQPTAFYDLTLCSTLQQDEILGPLALLSSFKYQHEAIKRANQSPYGQMIALFQKDAAKALKVAEKLEAGRVYLNLSETGAPWDPRMSFEGQKLSGLGAEGARDALRFYTRGSLVMGSW